MTDVSDEKDRTSGDHEAAGGVGFDTAAAVTRSLLGYGVIAGPIYVVVGLAQAVARDGFDPTRHSLSLLANGPWGWVQVANLVVVGLMVVAAAVGLSRQMRPARSVALLVAVFGAAMVVSGVFVADPMEGFPPGTPDGQPESVSASGTIHLAAGAVGFLALAGAAFAFARHEARSAAGGAGRRLDRWSRAAAGIVALSFVVGAAAATTPVGVPLLWLAVLVAWAWLGAVSVVVYRRVPHPDLHRRSAPA